MGVAARHSLWLGHIGKSQLGIYDTVPSATGWPRSFFRGVGAAVAIDLVE